MVDIHRAHAQSHKRGLIAYIILIGLLVYVATTKQFDAYITNILMQAVTYSVAVMGLTVVLGMCGQINLAQAAFFLAGDLVDQRKQRLLDEIDQPLEHLRLAGKMPVQRRLGHIQLLRQRGSGDFFRCRAFEHLRQRLQNLILAV